MALSKATTHAHNTEVTTLIQPEEIEEVEMGINPAAMKLIIDRLTDLYPNPVSSSVREVVSNAIDATAKLPASDRKAVEIYSPSSLNASFRVIDRGIGMSTDDVRKIYSQYGGSTKTDDFTQLGAYGLGAKAPLAYCSEFQVTTTKDGFTTIFTCSRKAMGNVTTIVSQERTGKPNGTEVVIPVKAHDLGEFRTAIDNFKKFAPDVPLIIDGKEVLTEEKYQFFDTIVLDEETDTRGRVWMNNSAARSYFMALSSGRFGYRSFSVKYVLSGWLYTISHSYDEPTFIVELKPGVVDFSSSRDSITRNDRSRALEERVVKYYSTMNDDLLAKTMAYFRKLPEEAAWNFALDLKIKTYDGLHVSVNNKRFDLSQEDFELTSGANPVKTFMEAKNNNSFGVVNLSDAAGSYSFSTAAARTDAIAVEVKSTGGRVGDITASLQKAVADNERHPLLYSVLGTRTSYIYYDSLTHDRDLVIVTDVDEAFTEELRKARTLLSKDIFANKLMALTTSVTDQELALCKQVLSSSVTVYTPAQVMELIVEARQERRKNMVKKEVDTEIEVGFIDATSFEKVTDFNNAKLSFASMKVSEMISENAVIVIGSDYLNVLKGAYNKGAKLVGRKVYALREPKHLRAGHFDLMLGYKDVYVDPEFTPRGKAATLIADTQKRHARLFNDEIQALTEGEVMRCVSRSTRLPDSVWVDLAVAASGTEYEAAFDAFTKIDHSFKNPYLYSSSLPELLEQAFGAEVAAKILAVDSALNELAPYETFEQSVYIILFNDSYYGRRSAPENDRQKALMASIVPHLFSFLVEKMAANSSENNDN